jgi:hypothetical protein
MANEPKIAEDVKTCSHCRKEKPASCFNKSRNMHDGFHCQCKECRRIYGVTHIEQRRAYYVANRDRFKDYRVEYNRRYKSENREYLREMDRLRRQRLKAKRLKTEKTKTETSGNIQLQLIDNGESTD